MGKRERVEDLGRISQKLYDVCDRIGDLELFLKSVKLNLDSEDIEEISTRISIISSEISDTYEIARWGDEEE